MSEQWTWQSSYPAPAKLNLFLHITGRRADGYHQLQTLFRLLDRGDSLQFSERLDGEIVLQRPLPGVPPEHDLTVRAARLLQTASGCCKGVNIELEKHLPMGGGLGGGSSDAATVLLALNHLWQLGLSRQRLQEMGLSLGADLPFFIFGQTAFAEGVGEILHATLVPKAYYVILEPPVQVPTALIFSAPELTRDTPPIAPQVWEPGWGKNELETVAVARFPIIADYLNWLSTYAKARMSGSGACVFAEFASRDAAAAVVAQAPAGMHAWLAAGLDRHPLHDLAPDAAEA